MSDPTKRRGQPGVEGIEAAEAEDPDPEPKQPPEANGARPSGEDTPLGRAQRKLGVYGPLLAPRLREAREEKGWKPLELAQIARVAPSTISNLEASKWAWPHPVTVLALAYALGYESVADLLADKRTAGSGEQEQRDSSRREAKGPGPIPLDQLVETVLRGAWTALDARPARGRRGAVADDVQQELEAGSAKVPEEEVRQASAETTSGAREHLPVTPGVTVFVPLVVLVQPRPLG